MNDTQADPDYWGIDNSQDLRDRGYGVFAPDMSMFMLGGVHRLCQAFQRDSVSGAES